MKFKAITLSGILFLSGFGFAQTSNASDSVTVSGVIQGALSVSQIRVLGLRPGNNGTILATSFVGKDGTYSLEAPINTPIEIQISGTTSVMSASWKRAYIFSKGTNLDFTIPVGQKLSGQIVDAQGNPLPLADVNLVKSKMDSTKISSDGFLWEGEYQIPVTQADGAGNFSIYVYPTKEINWNVNLQVTSYVPVYSWISPEFLVDGPLEFIVCIPLNFGVENSLPKNCTEDQAAQNKRILNERTVAADLKAKQEADAKAALDAKAAADKTLSDFIVARDAVLLSRTSFSNWVQAKKKIYPSRKAAIETYSMKVMKYPVPTDLSMVQTLEREISAMRSKIEYSVKIWEKLEKSVPTTITCVKGKLTKKVTAVKPLCPKGYKKK
jgi:hypothetical protein